MGTPKALLLFDGEPLIVHIVSALQRMVDEVVVVAAPGQELPSISASVVRDEVAYQGPVGGICYGLAAAGGEVCFVTSCDSVFLNSELVRHVLGRIAAYDVVVPSWGGRLQPLHAVYRRSVLPQLQAQLASGELRPVSLFGKVRTLEIHEDEIRRFDPEGWSFFNMNRPEDYAEALERWNWLSRAPTGDAAIGCRVELFGLPRLLAHRKEVSLTLPAGATFADVFAALAEQLPVLVGRVISSDRKHLLDGYACNLNGLEFVRSDSASVHPGDTIVILSADAGG